MTLITRMITD